MPGNSFSLVATSAAVGAAAALAVHGLLRASMSAGRAAATRAAGAAAGDRAMHDAAADRVMRAAAAAAQAPALPSAVADAAAEPNHHPYRVVKGPGVCSADAEVGEDWVAAALREVGGAMRFRPGGAWDHPPRILVLYGSLRERSFSRLLAYEAARLLEGMGAEVRVFDPRALPVRLQTPDTHPKVEELRALTHWSEGHVWVTPEMHGKPTGVFLNQIDWIPLNTGSVRPTQGRTLAVFEVSGGSQSFNAVNVLRLLGRWMRMITVPNQSSVPKAWTEFGDDDRMKPGPLRERVVDVCEELFKFTMLTRHHSEFLVDRYSERMEIAAKGRLLTQEEKEKEKRAKA